VTAFSARKIPSRIARELFCEAEIQWRIGPAFSRAKTPPAKDLAGEFKKSKGVLGRA